MCLADTILCVEAPRGRGGCVTEADVTKFTADNYKAKSLERPVSGASVDARVTPRVHMRAPTVYNVVYTQKNPKFIQMLFTLEPPVGTSGTAHSTGRPKTKCPLTTTTLDCLHEKTIII